MLGQVNLGNVTQTAYTRPQAATLSDSSPPPPGESFTATDPAVQTTRAPETAAPEVANPGQKKSVRWGAGIALTLALLTAGVGVLGTSAQATCSGYQESTAQVLVLNQSEFQQAQHDMDRLDLAGYLKEDARSSAYLSSEKALNRMQLGDPVFYGDTRDGKYTQIKDATHLHQLAEKAARETPR